MKRIFVILSITILNTTIVFGQEKSGIGNQRYEEIIKQLEITIKHTNKDSKEYLLRLFDISQAYYLYGNYVKAQEACSELLKHNLDSNLDIKYKAQSVLVDILSAMRQHTEAIKLCSSVLQNEPLWSMDREEIIKKLIRSYEQIGDIENTIAWNEKLLGLTGITVEYLDNEAQRYALLHDYISECDFRLKAMDLRREIFGEDSPEYAEGLIFAANSMTRNNSVCDNSIVSKFTDAGLDILLRHSHKNLHRLLLYAMANYKAIGRYDDAEICLYSVIEEKLPEEVNIHAIANNMSGAATYWKLSREDMISVLDNFVTWANIKRLQKNYISSSLTYTGIIVYMLDNNLGSIEDLSRHIDCLMGLAKNEEELQNYEQCEFFLSEALAILLENDVTWRDIRIKNVYHDLVEIFGKTKQYAKQLKIAEDGLEYISNDIFEKWLFLSSDQRDVYWYQNNLLFKIAPATYWRLSPDVDVSKLYSGILLTKGLLLNSEIELKKHIENSTNNQIANKYKELRRINTQLERQWSDSLVYLSENIERKLLRESKTYGDYTRNLKLKWNDVQAQLSDNDVAIEFIDFVVPNSDSTMYAALLVRKDWAAPKMITLFEERQLEKLTRAGAEKSYIDSVGKQITNLVWRSLEEYFNEGDNIYFSPSGMLHQKAIESLPTDDGRLMSEKYNLHRVSSTREICYKKPTPKYEKVVLYGGLFYDLDDHIMVAESRNYTSSMSRGFEADSVFRGSWGVLPGAKRELMSIAKLRPNATIFEGEAGNEESFRALSGRGNEIIHVATHGFFLPIEKARNGNYNSMSRSGLILSGGNRAWRGDAVPDGVEDGILTAAEISTLDLRGADLVVLSACDTGLGEVSGEGVFGLQRAFKMAGAGTLVMSLWKVHDDATALMMSEFYANLFAGKSKRESFLTAQAAVRAKFILPHYWAAFIMLD